MPRHATDAQAPPSVNVGTSGWCYDHWNDSFYPKGVRGAKRLPYYAERFATVEVNSTFYRFPTDAMFTAWNGKLPPNFVLSIKGSRRITHCKGLPEQSTVDYFLARISHFEQAAVVLWQLPPHRKQDAAYLDGFLQTIKRAPDAKRLRHSIEFRHPSWWHEATYAALRAHGVAMVNISHPTLPDTVIHTAPWTYLRFHGLSAAEKYHYNYSHAQLAAWAKALRDTISTNDVYVYFNNDIGGHALRNAQDFRILLKS
jgi:uncharacterized protein YecE (DUF72 family)